MIFDDYTFWKNYLNHFKIALMAYYDVMLIACRIVKCQYWNLIFICRLVYTSEYYQACILYFVPLYTATNKPESTYIECLYF